MPVHWDPWPGKTNATLAPERAVPCTRPGASAVPSASEARAAGRSSPKTTARWVKEARVRTRPAATASGAPAPARKVRSLPPWSYSAAAFLADNGQGAGTPVSTGTAASPADGFSASGACSRMTWALVPLMPNEDTAARRGLPVSGQATASVTSSTAPAVQSTCGVGSSTFRVGGTTPCCRASTILMTPAIPAADCVWPMLDFTEPSSSGRPSGRSWPYVARTASASIGSPRVVPVPCASRASMSDAASPALASAERMTRCCEGPLGAVRPFDAPSWLTAEPRMTDRTRWPLRRASESRSTSNTPTPSPQAVPSAAAANALTRPSWESPRCLLNSVKAAGVDITITPPTTASELSLVRSDCAARCSAVSEEEQAVSTVTAGPSNPYV